MNTIDNDFKYWSLFYEEDGYNITGDRIMGRQAAGWSYLKALVKNSNDLSVYLKTQNQKESLIKKIRPLISDNKELNFNTIPYNSPNLSKEYGGIFYPGPGIAEFANHRSYFGHDNYSIVGITHTTASHKVMSDISNLAFSDVMPWDAIICTSQSVVDTVQKILNHKYEKISHKISVDNIIYPKMPVIPLGLDKDEFNFSDEYKSNTREELNINKNDIVLVYVGRLSFHAKAHHLPMYLAAEECAKNLKNNQNLHIIQTGWFANDFVRDAFVSEGKEICPSVKLHFLDGKNQNNKYKTLAAGDIFVSLSDNIQETFGLTPLEGMASGLPVLVSDWNGYKSTVRNNNDGFRVRTYSVNDGYGEDIAFSHMMDLINYDNYVGMSVQRVAIDVKDCIDKLNILINDKDLRKKFGNSGRARVEENFDWPKILSQYKDLSKELNQIREVEKENYLRFCNPSLPSDKLDPFYLFSSYPSEILNSKHIFTKLNGVNSKSIEDILMYSSINYSKNFISSDIDIKAILELFEQYDNLNLEKINSLSNLNEEKIYKILIFLLKYGYVTIVRKENE